MISGIIPSMIYYGLKLINVSFFLPTCVIISAIVAISTGSSWSTTATIGIGLIGIGKVLGFDLGLVAGAIISGAYFGDKMSPLSDTTNLAAAVTESNLFEHIKYMTITTFPTIIITIIFFTSYNIFNMPSESIKNLNYVESIKDYFFISPILFFVPIVVIVLIIKKISPVISLFIGIMQCVAMWPGTSRSMMTIVGGYFVGLERAKAAEFSFLLGLITLTAAAGYKGLTKWEVMSTNLELGPLFWGCFVAGISAALSVFWLVGYLTRRGLGLFVWYRMILSLVILYFYFA